MTFWVEFSKIFMPQLWLEVLSPALSLAKNQTSGKTHENVRLKYFRANSNPHSEPSGWNLESSDHIDLCTIVFPDNGGFNCLPTGLQLSISMAAAGTTTVAATIQSQYCFQTLSMLTVPFKSSFKDLHAHIPKMRRQRTGGVWHSGWNSSREYPRGNIGL